MESFAPNSPYPQSSDKEAPNIKSPYEANQFSTIARENSSRSRRSRFTDLVLRILAVLLSVIAFATMASDSKSAVVSDNTGNTSVGKLKFSYFDSTKAVVSANILVCVYSLAQTSGALISIFARHSLLPSPTSEFISFILDQIFAYLLLATSASGATLVSLMKHGGGDSWFMTPICIKGSGLSGFCTLAAASVSMSFFTFAVVAISAVQSGYFLAKHIFQS